MSENEDIERGRERRSCAETRRLLVAFLDGEASPEERALVSGHLSDCPSCAREARFERELGAALDGVHAQAGPTTSLEAARALAAGIRKRAREIQRRRTASRALALAAAALVAVGLYLGWPWSEDGAGRPPSDELLTNLDVLEAIEEEGVEPSRDLVQLLLEPQEGQAPSDSVIDPAIFDSALEEEVLLENL
jgi:hypothetical protein